MLYIRYKYVIYQNNLKITFTRVFSIGTFLKFDIELELLLDFVV